MKSRFLTRAALGALGITLLAVGCKPGGASHVASASTKTGPQEKAAVQLAAMASSAIRARRGDLAVAFSERAVAASPHDASYRAQLGQSYLLAGRFASAADSFRDALTLAPGEGRATLGLALAQAGMDHSDAARTTIVAAEGTVPDADRGLALALAGDTDGAIAMLEPAARSAKATAKTRQNLALAYAMAGRWDVARATAAQDVAAGDLDARMTQWAVFARPRNRTDVVATFLGVVPTQDPGMPAQLALAPTTAATALAAADPVAAPAAMPAAPAEPVRTVAMVTQGAADAPAPATQTAAFTAPSPEAPLVAADTRPVREAAIRPSSAPLLMRADYVKPVRDSWAVQLGAFATERGSESAWTKVSGRIRAVTTMTPLASTIRLTHGATFHRLSVGGIPTREAAVQLCARVRQAGGVCFVRPVTDEAPPIQWAALRRQQDRLASR